MFKLKPRIPMILEIPELELFTNMLNYNPDSLEFYPSSWFSLYLVKLKPGRRMSGEPHSALRDPITSSHSR